MSAAATDARERLSGLLAGTVVATEHALPAPLRVHDRVLLENAEESIFADLPFQLLPIREITRGRTIANTETDTTVWYSLRIGFLQGVESSPVATEMELTVERVRRLFMSALNWTPAMQRVVVTEAAYTYALPPDRRTMVRLEIEVDLRSDWTVAP